MPVRYELLIRFNEQTGVLKGALARYSDGSIMPITPETLGDWLPQALTDALATNQALTAERDTALSDLATRTAERNTAVADLATRTAERDALQQQIDAAAAAAAHSVEAHKARIELIVRGEWSQILAIVDGMPEPQRSIAHEALYAPSYSRASSMLALIAQAMGWTDADVDERFAAAAARVV